MANVTMTRGKFEGITACANERGIIAAAAMDQRGSLKKAIAKARGEGGQATADDMTAFKTAVAKILTRHASAIPASASLTIVSDELISFFIINLSASRRMPSWCSTDYNIALTSVKMGI